MSTVPVIVIVIDRLPVLATSHDVVKSAGKFEAQAARHESQERSLNVLFQEMSPAPRLTLFPLPTPNARTLTPGHERDAEQLADGDLVHTRDGLQCIAHGDDPPTGIK